MLPHSSLSHKGTSLVCSCWLPQLGVLLQKQLLCFLLLQLSFAPELLAGAVLLLLCTHSAFGCMRGHDSEHKVVYRC